ncbi:MAG: hypothetical protein DMG28_06295 [Acidobacteria bacterium]|nr:MAG: hypothetical protein DMG28_06295 [Acidobacteriota bacterium]
MRCKVERQILAWLLGLVTLLGIPRAGSASDDEDEFILRCSPEAIQEVVRRHGLTLIHSHESQDIHFVRAPATAHPEHFLSNLRSDPDVQGIEADTDVMFPEARPGLKVDQSTASILDTLSHRTLVPFYGSRVLSSYVNQPAIMLIQCAEAHQLATGAGIVAVIDRGVDPNHPVLKASLVPGFDFTRNLPGMPSEFADLGQSTASILDQSTASILDQQTILILNQSTASILDQSTASILDTRQVPRTFGHGTMVAGIIHLVAPAAQIIPLKAFEADGTAHLFDILRAIYYAVDHGAKVINMSFSTEQRSAEMKRAINYAVSRGVICVSSAGNNGSRLRVYPAAFDNVLGVGSTSNLDARSTFSNFGDQVVTLAAPGEGIITTYPGGHYAAAWGTSFSTAFVSGGAALLLQMNTRTNQEAAADALEGNAKQLPDRLGLGEGRIDLYRALMSVIQP